jgi:threonylcarbamoyladenosine tRNA methylthiotransferase MtaB
VPTFSIQTLGCRVNHYESEQIASLLRSRGWIETESGPADLRVINSCSVTVEAASKSRQSARRAVKLNVLGHSSRAPDVPPDPHGKVIVTGCWATSDPEEARRIPGVDAVVSHHENVADRLNALLAEWESESTRIVSTLPSENTGTRSLPLLGDRQSHHQRAFLKIQDGCDAHCTYCIIPRLRPSLWSKPRHEAVDEARRLVDAGHVELVLTGIFLGAYGQPTALRRRQPPHQAGELAQLIDDLCTKVPGLLRLRLSSIEPGDLTENLLATLKSRSQVVPHFHLPLQSGSDEILGRMNRQYTRADYLRLIDSITQSFDRPALTTDIIVGFPGESDPEFQKTLQVANHARFIHIHAFGYSPRPQTAAARWKQNVANGVIVRQRIDALTRAASAHSRKFRESFLGQTVQLLVEKFDKQSHTQCPDTDAPGQPHLRHGRCERYFDVHFQSPAARPGDLAKVKIEHVTSGRTFGCLVGKTINHEAQSTI